MSPVFVFLFGVLALSSATQVSFVPVGKEIVYDYFTEVVGGTYEPVRYGSRFYIKAKLHVQGIKNDVVGFKLTDIMFRINNGEIDALDYKDLVFLPIPTESVELTYPFLVQYDTTGKVLGFHSDVKDKEWSVNIKRAIMNVFQFDTEVLKNVKHNDFAMVPEETLYGRCDVKYSIIHLGDNIELFKALDPYHCMFRDETPAHKYSFVEKLNSKSKLFAGNSNREYKLVFDGYYRIEKVVALGDVVFTPYKSRSDVQHFKTVQSFVYTNIVDFTEAFTVNEHVEYKGLKYFNPVHHCVETSSNMIDLTGGRYVYKFDTMIPKVYQLLDEFVEYTDSNQITMKKYDVKHSQIANRLYEFLQKFDVASFEQMFTTLSEKKDTPKDERKFKIFIHFLPNIGTRSSVVFIRNVIRKQKIPEYLAVRIVQNFPTHVKCANEKLLQEIEDFVTIVTDTKSKLYRACVLSYATLLSKVYQDVNEKSEFLEKFISTFVAKMRETNEYHLQLMYVRALGNIRNGAVLKYLDPFITGEEKCPHKLRVQILWAMTSRFMHDYHLAAKYILPIITNRHLDSELRIVAYTIFALYHGHVHRYFNLYWFMISEKNELFYTYHYNTMLSISRCEKSDESEYARAILRLSRKPIQHTHNLGFYVNSMEFEKYNFGGYTEHMVYQTKDVFSFYSSVSTFAHDYPIHLFGMYFRVHGLDPKFYHDFMKYFSDMKTFNFSFDFFKKMIADVDEHFHVEMVVSHKRKVMMTYFFDKTNVFDLFKTVFDLHNFDKDFTDNMQNVFFPLSVEKVVPSDFGFPLVFFEYLPVVKSMKLNYRKEMKDDFVNFHFNMRFKLLVNGRTGMKFYNPVNDLWQGIMKIKSFSFVFPLNFDFFYNYKTFDNFRFVFHKVQTDDVFGVQNYYETFVFVQGLEHPEFLTKFDKDAVAYHYVTRGASFQKTGKMYEGENHFFGRKVEFGYFDCEREVGIQSFVVRMKEMYDKHFFSFSHFYAFKPFFFTDYLYKMMFLHTYLFSNPGMGRCGYTFRMFPSVEKPIEQIEFVMKKHHEELSEEHTFLAEKKCDSQMTITHMGAGNKPVRTYDMTFLMNFGKHHMENMFHFTFLHKETGFTDFKFDMDFKQKYTVDYLEGLMKFTFGEADKVGIVDVHAKAEWSEEEKMMFTDKTFTYDECMREVSIDRTYYPRSFECMFRSSLFHHYTADITFNDLENYYVRQFLSFKRKFFDRFMKYKHEMVKKEVTDKKTYHMEFTFPITRREVDFKIETPYTVFDYHGVPVEYYLHNFHPFFNYHHLRNAFFSNHFNYLFHHNYIKTCVADYNKILTETNSIVSYNAGDDWILYAGDAIEHPKFAVYVKKVNGHKPLALKVVIDTNVFEVIPFEHACKLTVNGKEVEFGKFGYHVESFFNYFYVPNPQIAMFMTHKYGLHIEFDGYSVRMHYPYGTMMPTVGKCFV